MRDLFWTNTSWFLLLFALSAVMAAVAIARSDNRRFMAAFMAALLGLYYLFEYVLLAVLDAYAYHPGFTPGDPFLDSVIGNVVSQTSIAAACAFIIAFRLKTVWYFVFAAAYYSIELLFVWLGIYDTHWYRSIYTPVILAPLFWAAKRWHGRAAVSGSRAGDNALLFLGTVGIFSTAVRMPLHIAGIHLFTGHFFSDRSRDSITTSMFYGICFNAALIAIYRARLRRRWKAALLAGVYAVQYAAFKAGLMEFSTGWFIWATLLEIGLCLSAIAALDRLIRTRAPAAVS